MICTAAVADWQVKKVADTKIKKSQRKTPKLNLIETPDILSWIGHHSLRPTLVVGFAAETNTLKKNAAEKRIQKNADWVLANSILQSGESVFNSDINECIIIESDG